VESLIELKDVFKTMISIGTQIEHIEDKLAIPIGISVEVQTNIAHVTMLV